MKINANIRREVAQLLDLRVGQQVYIPYRPTRNSALKVKETTVEVIVINLTKREEDVYIIGLDNDGVRNSYTLAEIRLSSPEAINEIVRSNIVEELQLTELMEDDIHSEDEITRLRAQTNRGDKFSSRFEKERKRE